MDFNDNGPRGLRLPTARPLDRITGAEGPLKLRSWLAAMSRSFNALATPDATRAAYCGNFVLDEAATWYDSSGAGQMTWENFCLAFMQRFIPHDVEAELIVQLFDLIQGGYDLSKYIARFETLYTMAHEDMSDRSAKELFVRGLDPYIRTDAMAQVVPDLQSAFTLARRLHLAKEADGKVPRRKVGDLPSRPRNVGHQEPAIRNSDAMDVDLNRVSTTQNSNVRTCYRCHQSGHFIRNCPLPRRNKDGEQRSGNARAQ